MTASLTTTPDCGCGCGGSSSWPSAFVRPRFFAGQLLTEDDLTLLVDYTTAKTRLHNRNVLGPGVICGFEVGCDPCGGGHVVVRPGHALDCRGNDIVLACKETVDVAALVRELRVSSLGVTCDDPCDDGKRGYGLYVRYEETPVDPVAPYATEEPCPNPGCAPSRVREGFRFLVKYDDPDDHRYNPGTRLLASIGPLGRYEDARLRAQQFTRYLDPMAVALAISDRPVEFDEHDEERYDTSLARLRDLGSDPVPPAAVPGAVETVRALASAVARYDTQDEAGQSAIRERVGEITAARQVLGSVCDRLADVVTEVDWPDAVHAQLAAAVIAEARARVVPDPPGTDAPLEVRLLAQGTPISNVLQTEFRRDLDQLRSWLLGRLDRAPGVADCAVRDLVRGVQLPQLLPTPEPDPAQVLTRTDLKQIHTAAVALTSAVRRFVTDAMCATLNPPCTDCTDTDVLLAHLELDDCDVVRVCSATREQVLPGGSAYGEWLPKLYPLREMAQRLCCQPVPVYQEPTIPPEDPVRRAYVAGLLEPWPRTGDLETMWDLLLNPAPGETAPKGLHEQLYTVPTEVTDSLQELNALRAQIRDLTATVDALHAQLDTARDQVSEVREQLPDRLGSRLAELESAPAKEEPASKAAQKAPQKEEPRTPAARRTRSSSSRTQRPKPGESS